MSVYRVATFGGEQDLEVEDRDGFVFVPLRSEDEGLYQIFSKHDEFAWIGDGEVIGVWRWVGTGGVAA